MITLAIRTDNKEAELYLYKDGSLVVEYSWLAHKELSKTLHKEIINLLEKQSLALADLSGIIIYKGPGSFTGLRIGCTVANTLADSLEVPIVGESGQSWQEDGQKRLIDKQNDAIVLPEYGGEPNITQPRK